MLCFIEICNPLGIICSHGMTVVADVAQEFLEIAWFDAKPLQTRLVLLEMDRLNPLNRHLRPNRTPVSAPSTSISKTSICVFGSASSIRIMVIGLPLATLREVHNPTPLIAGGSFGTI
jgi:hypothetical protein